MNDVLQLIAVGIAGVTGVLWLLMDHADRRRRRDFDRHMREALRLVNDDGADRG